MDRITDVIVVIALVLFVVEEVRAKGQSLMAWGSILVCLALLWHLIPT
jgi:drug/metabolite transporter superfamily protein YnfA